MSSREVKVHDDAKQQQVIGRINNALRSGREQGILSAQQKIGRINNEQEPRLQREIPPEQQVIGVINNEKRD
jgi:hypothetical protein